MRRAVKHDGNHSALTATLRRVGWPFLDVSRLPGLGCDLITVRLGGAPLFVEIKRPGPPSARTLTESEEKLRAMFPGHYAVVQTEKDLLEAVGLLVRRAV